MNDQIFSSNTMKMLVFIVLGIMTMVLIDPYLNFYHFANNNNGN